MTRAARSWRDVATLWRCLRPAGSPVAAVVALALGALSTAVLTGCLAFHSGPMPGEPKDATFLQVDGVRLRYLDTGGDGPPVVLLHGFASAIENWAPVIPKLQGRYRLIALDLKGFGWSDRPEGDYSPQEEARLVVGLMDRLGVQRAAVVAHSWGSSVALALALQAPERVSRIALYDAWVYEDQIPSFFLWARADGLGEFLVGAWYDERPDDRMTAAFYDKSMISEALIDEVEDALDRPGTKAAALAAIRGQRFSDLETSYGRIQKPTLLLWGRDDEVTTLEMGERLVRQLPDARLVVYERCGHFPMIEAAPASTRDLLSFLAEEGAP